MPPQSGQEYFHIPQRTRSTRPARRPKRAASIPALRNGMMQCPNLPPRITETSPAQVLVVLRIPADHVAAGLLGSRPIVHACPRRHSPCPLCPSVDRTKSRVRRRLKHKIPPDAFVWDFADTKREPVTAGRWPMRSGVLSCSSMYFTCSYVSMPKK